MGSTTETHFVWSLSGLSCFLWACLCGPTEPHSKAFLLLESRIRFRWGLHCEPVCPQLISQKLFELLQRTKWRTLASHLRTEKRVYGGRRVLFFVSLRRMNFLSERVQHFVVRTPGSHHWETKPSMNFVWNTWDFYCFITKVVTDVQCNSKHILICTSSQNITTNILDYSATMRLWLCVVPHSSISRCFQKQECYA